VPWHVWELTPASTLNIVLGGALQDMLMPKALTTPVVKPAYSATARAPCRAPKKNDVTIEPGDCGARFHRAWVHIMNHMWDAAGCCDCIQKVCANRARRFDAEACRCRDLQPLSGRFGFGRRCWELPAESASAPPTADSAAGNGTDAGFGFALWRRVERPTMTGWKVQV